MINKELKKLITDWTHEQIKPEMAIGRIICQVKSLWQEAASIKKTQSKHDKALREAKQERIHLQAEIKRLLKHNKLKPLAPDKPPKRRPRKDSDWWEDADVGDPNSEK
ncbi:hypothetical protein QUF58_14920 [Anaerolineales bacterium HSG24]|nr:hypothetical protein [Anaerolineales bacterium HSG24]